MNIIYRKKIIKTITTIDEVTEYIKDKNFKKLIPLIENRIKRLIDGPDMPMSTFENEIRRLFKTDKGTGPRLVGYWVNRGYSQDEAKQQVSNIQKENNNKLKLKYASGEVVHNWSRAKLPEDEADSILFARAKRGNDAKLKKMKEDPAKYKHTFTTNIEYYLEQGMSYDDALKGLKERQNTSSYAKIIDKYGEIEGKKKYNSIIDKKRETRIANGNGVSESDYTDFELYKRKVWQHTKKHLREIHNIEMRGNDFHLDHKYSMKQGWLDNIPTYIIGSKNNLEILPALENKSKQAKCSVSLDYLINML